MIEAAVSNRPPRPRTNSAAHQPESAAVEKSGPAEVGEVHTRLLRLALGVEESRAYWANVDPRVPAAPRAIHAFEQRWYGAKSLERVRTLHANFAARYDAHPDALAVLRRHSAMDPQTRQIICHWHLQLTDPLYRDFTGRFLVERREGVEPTVDRDIALRWVQRAHPDRWSAATCIQFASKLLSATSEAGLITTKRDPRKLLYPKVPDIALAYLMYLLRGLRFEGTLLDNLYVSSVGLTGALLEQRLRALPGLTFRRMANVTEFEWAAPDLPAWADLVIGPRPENQGDKPRDDGSQHGGQA